MNTLGERLRYARKGKGFTQDTLAEAISVSRGVIYNLEKNKTEPKAIVLNAVCKTLNLNKEWLLSGSGEMENNAKASKSAKTLIELYKVAEGLSECEQLYLLDIVKAMKTRLGSDGDG